MPPLPSPNIRPRPLQRELKCDFSPANLVTVLVPHNGPRLLELLDVVRDSLLVGSGKPETDENEGGHGEAGEDADGNGPGGGHGVVCAEPNAGQAADCDGRGNTPMNKEEWNLNSEILARLLDCDLGIVFECTLLIRMQRR